MSRDGGIGMLSDANATFFTATHWIDIFIKLSTQPQDLSFDHWKGNSLGRQLDSLNGLILLLWTV